MSVSSVHSNSFKPLLFPFGQPSQAVIDRVCQVCETHKYNFIMSGEFWVPTWGLRESPIARGGFSGQF